MSNIYQGPNPTELNSLWCPHQYDGIVCLLNGEVKKKIESGYLRKLGHTRESYLTLFPGAPLVCQQTRERYAQVTDARKQARSKNLTKLNEDQNFQLTRQEGCRSYWLSSASDQARIDMSDKAYTQHQNGLMDHIRSVYWETKYQGSDEQIRKSDRMKGESNVVHLPGVKEKIRATRILNSFNQCSFKHARWKDSHLTYQSTYEMHFIEKAVELQVPLSSIANGKVFTSEGLFYLCDYILFDKYVVEVKSWYIEQLQEQNKPGCLVAKKEVVKSAGYDWLYILDKDYSELEHIVLQCLKP